MPDALLKAIGQTYCLHCTAQPSPSHVDSRAQNSGRPWYLPSLCRGVVPGGAGWHIQILADQLTLLQPDCDHLITTGTPGFSDLPTALQYDESFYLQTLKQWKFPSTYKCLNHISDLPKWCKKATCHWSSIDLERKCLKSRWNYKQVARASICRTYE